MSSGNAKLAGTVINTALELGVNDFVVCAGARNIPLIADLNERNNVKIWNHFDERSAAFFATGLVHNYQPVAVITTSGTAVAELLPAVIEAWYSGIPLVLITADRPVRFRGSGAPQAIEQAGIFYGYVCQFLDLEPRDEQYQEIEWNHTPLHINVCFEEPVDEPADIQSPSLKISLNYKEPTSHVAVMPVFENPVAVVGQLTECYRERVVNYLVETKIPVWLEAQSGIREHPDLSNQRIEQESEIQKIAPGEIIRIGGVPSLRYWRDLEDNDQIRVINISRLPFSGLARTENVTTLGFSKLTDLTGLYPVHSASVQGTVTESLKQNPASEPALIAHLSRMIPENAAVFLGNSLPIREWNLAADYESPHPHCFANRGANGIDGEVSTWLGISKRYEESWGIFGDLTALYDLNAPWLLNQLPKARRRIVVLNNGGGRIFSRLASTRKFAAMAENQHTIDFSDWANMWNMQYLQWNDDVSTWKLPTDHHAVIEIRIEQEKSEAFWNMLNS